MSIGIKSRIGLLKSSFMYRWSFIHHRRLKKFYEELLADCNLCFDVGAHLGDRSNCFLNLDKKVVGIEPQPMFAAQLRKRFKNNANFILEEVGLGEKKGKGQLQISSLHPTVSTVASLKWQNSLNARANNKIKWDKKVDIDILTLDLLVEKYGRPDFCKIDVEGFELEVLKGLTSPLRLISIEFFSFTMDRTLACLEAIETLGNFRYNLSLKDSLKMEFDAPIAKPDLIKYLESLSHKTITGDIYAFYNSVVRNQS